jgi:hypothetical protein
MGAEISREYAEPRWHNIEHRRTLGRSRSAGIPKSNSAPGSNLFFTAGPDNERNGLFSTLTPRVQKTGTA